jgi:hypothetical protein
VRMSSKKEERVESGAEMDGLLENVDEEEELGGSERVISCS